DLRGRAVIVDAPNTSYAFQVYEVLKLNGLNKGDYEVRPVGATIRRFEMIKTDKSAGASTLSPPFWSLAKRAGLKDMGEIVQMIGPYQGTSCWVMKPWAAATSGGAGDPDGFRLEDCATQRNLTEQGRAAAKSAGEQIRAQKIPIEKILSSQWCRCRDTATLMALGPIETAETFNNAYALSERRDQLTKGARGVIAAWRGPGVLMVGTRGANILPLTGCPPAGGEMV